MNFASLKIMCKILTTYQAFCNSFSTVQNSAVQCQMANRANYGRYYIVTAGIALFCTVENELQNAW
jgi:hypothetical protein